MERPEARPRAGGAREADDDEPRPAGRVDLPPVGRAAAEVPGIGTLGHDPLEAHLLHLPEERLATPLEVFAEADGARLGHDGAQVAPPLGERKVAQIAVVEREQVEGVEACRRLERGAPDIVRTREPGALLQAPEARIPRRVVDDDFAVQHDPPEGEFAQRARDVRERRERVVSVARQEAPLAIDGRGQHAVAVQLEFEVPRGVVERVLARLGEHELHLRRVDRPLRRTRRLEGRGHALPRIPPLLPPRHLLDGEPGEDGTLGERPILEDRVPAAPLADEQPLLPRLPLLEPHERPHALELVAPQFEQELAVLQSLLRILEHDAAPDVPHDHLAAAVLARRNYALELDVLDGVVLDVDGELLVGGIGRDPLWHCPRDEDAPDLQAQVVVQPGRRVQLDDEHADPRRGRPPEGLRRALGRSLLTVLLESPAGHARGAPSRS